MARAQSTTRRAPEPVLSSSVSAGVRGGVPGTWSWASGIKGVGRQAGEGVVSRGCGGLHSSAPGRAARADGSALPLCCRNETSRWSWETITLWTCRVRAGVRVGKQRQGSRARTSCSCALIPVFEKSLGPEAS